MTRWKAISLKQALNLPIALFLAARMHEKVVCREWRLILCVRAKRGYLPLESSWHQSSPFFIFCMVNWLYRPSRCCNHRASAHWGVFQPALDRMFILFNQSTLSYCVGSAWSHSLWTHTSPYAFSIFWLYIMMHGDKIPGSVPRKKNEPRNEKKWSTTTK